MPPALVVTGKYRPHEALFLAFSAVVGAAFVVGAKPPGTLEQLLPAWVLWTWYLLLLASGALGLASFALADVYRALVLERAAMVGQVSAAVLYGLGLAVYGQATALFAALFMFAWAGASAWRAWQVHQGVRAFTNRSTE